MKFLKVLWLVLFFFFSGVSFAFGSGFYITEEQMEKLTNEINIITNSNNNLINKLELQQEQYQKLIQVYENKYTLAQDQLQTYKNYSQRLENKSSIYKYGIGIAFAIGLVLGVVLVK